MKKARFTESQILRVLKEVEGGRHVKDVCRENGVSEASYYNWKSRYGGMESSDIKRMKELEDENRRLKQMYASLSLDHEILKDVVAKMYGSPPFCKHTMIKAVCVNVSGLLQVSCFWQQGHDGISASGSQ